MSFISSWYLLQDLVSPLLIYVVTDLFLRGARAQKMSKDADFTNSASTGGKGGGGLCPKCNDLQEEPRQSAQQHPSTPQEHEEEAKTTSCPGDNHGGFNLIIKHCWGFFRWASLRAQP